MLGEGVKAGLLQSDICIVAEDDTYAVFAVRVEKATIQKNISLCSYLSNITPSLGESSERRIIAKAPKLRLGKMVRTAAFAGVTAAIILALTAHNAQSIITAPVEIYSVKLLTPSIAPGGELLLQVVGLRNRLCPQNVEVSIKRINDGVDVYRGRLSGGTQSSTGGIKSLLFGLRLPRGIPPGNYQYQRVLYDECDGHTFAAVVANGLPFTVTDPPPG